MHRPSHQRTAARRTLRGNTIVLVTAILVLLVIIATAFVGRTRAVRQISAAQLSSAGRDSRAESIATNVAQEISDSLFVRPLDGFFNATLGPTGAPDLNDPFKRVYIPAVSGLPPTDPELRPIVVASSSWPRLSPFLDAQRYAVDRDFLSLTTDPNNVLPGDGIPDFGYNFAPYETKPWTNWPDQFGGTSTWPLGPGAPAGVATLIDGITPIPDGNPYGNPGTGDTRWLRSTEPVRVGVDQNGDGLQDVFTFSHWQHLSWLPHANNAWRVVADITNIVPNTLDNMNEADTTRSFAVAIPYEQWLPNVFPSYPAINLSSTSSVNTFNNDFLGKRNQWFAPFDAGQTYLTNFRDPTRVLPNFFRLRELGTPSDEFRAGTPRHTVASTFTDTDGDGFTDSFWFTGPVNTDRAVRTLVGVSIVDNSALLNANVATKFSFGYDADPALGLNSALPGTIGQTPADLALVTSRAEYPPFYGQGNTVGFFDGPVNQPSTDPIGGFPLPTYWTGTPQLGFPSGIPRFNRDRFGDTINGAGNWVNEPSSFLMAIGMRGPSGGADGGVPSIGFDLTDDALPTQLRGLFESSKERLSYFKMVGLDPERPLFGLTPFDTSDEFELRAYHANNLPFSLSRFEQAVSLYSPALQGDTANDFQFLRASPMRQEASETLDQLDARQLLVDNRRKLTLFNGARNDGTPPWLWTTPYYDETFNYMDPRGAVPATSDPAYAAFQDANRAEYERQKIKVDLREPMFVENDGVTARLTRNPFAALQWRRDLQRLFENALARKIGRPASAIDPQNFESWESYFGTREGDYNRSLSLIASYAANLDCATDEPVTLGTGGAAFDHPLYPNQPTVDPSGYFPPQTDAVPDPTDQDRFYLGMEKQPYIMEVFFGLVYPASQMSASEWVNAGGLASEISDPFEIPDVATAGGSRFVDSSSKPTAVIAVQIANPYDTPLPLASFQLEWFGKKFSFLVPGGPYGLNPVLPPATLGRPSTAIVYAASNGAVGTLPATQFRARVLDFFDLEPGEMNGASLQASDLDGDGLIEYANLYDSRGPLPDADPLDRTLVFDATTAWDVNDVESPQGGTGGALAANPRYRNATESVRLLRVIPPPAGVPGTPKTVVVDRFENKVSGRRVDFIEPMKRLFEDPQLSPPPRNYQYSASRKSVDCIRLEDNDYYMTWLRSSRIWALDVSTWTNNAQAGDPRISAEELSPRYVFSVATRPALVTRGLKGVRGTNADAPYTGEMFKSGTDPDTNVTTVSQTASRWPRFNCFDVFGERILRSKPVFFSNIVAWPASAPVGAPVEVVYEVTPGGAPIPFLPNQMDPYPEAQTGTTEFAGTEYVWQIGGKGVGAITGEPTNPAQSEWVQFAQLDSLAIPFQVNQRDSDFDQIGEVLDVFVWGHVFENWATPETVRTFSEILVDDDEDSEFYPGTGPYLNRLQLGGINAPVFGRRFEPGAAPGSLDPVRGYRPWRPALPLGISILDGLTIDGPGRNTFDRNANSLLSADLAPGTPALHEPAGPNADFDLARAEERQFRLANSFTGRMTPGLVNINTALPEVMQALPMMTRAPKNADNFSPYSHVVDMIRAYRDLSLFGAPSPIPNPPTYVQRGRFGEPDDTRFFEGMRTEQGFASLGELMLLRRTPEGVPPHFAASYSMQWLGLDPYFDLDGDFNEYDRGYAWGTDRTIGRPRQLPEDIFLAVTPPALQDVPFKLQDEPLGDAEDLNLLFKGISNLVTTRSDVFTVYLRVRQVRQNPVNLVWDGTNPEFIVDDSRYVMCVDRSQVQSPSDQPRILYFQKIPN